MISPVLQLMESDALAELFLKIVNMSISAGWLILAVLLLRFVLKKAPKWIFVLLWGFVGIRLICPFTLESAWSLIPSAETVSPEIMLDWTPEISTGIGSLDRVVNPVITNAFAPEPIASANPLQILIPVAANLWLLGVLLMLLYAAFSYLRLHQKLRTAVLLRDDIFQSEYVDSPFVLGIIKPKIYLPFQMGAQEMDCVIAHEQAHICRGDHWWKPLGFLLLVIHWFNPLVWLSYGLLCRDIELACDEKVIEELENEERADYTQALVSCSVNHRRVAACPLAFGEVGVKARIKSVMNYKKPAVWVIALAAAACVIVAVCFLTNPKQDCYSLRVVVPPGGHEQFVYTEEEISPLGKYITVYCGEGMGDASVILKPMQVRTETAYDQEWYITPGLTVKLEAEKGGWFKVGVRMWNETGEDKIVYVNVEDVEVRISSAADEVLHLGLNAEIIDIDEAKQILYVKDTNEAAAVFGERCAIDCTEAIEKYNLLYVNYDGEGDVRTIDFDEFRVGDAVIIGLRNREKQTAFNGTAVAEQVQLATQRLDQPPVIHYPAHKSLYEPTPIEQIEGNDEREEFVISKLHYENLNGEWVCEGYTYKNRLEITGRLRNAAKNTTYLVLSNTKDITFEQTWRASGLSSNMDDYFDPEVAVIVGSRFFS